MELEDVYSNPEEKGKEPLPTPPNSPDIRSSPLTSDEEDTIPYSPFHSPASPPASGIKEWLDVKKDPRRFRDSGRFTLTISTMDVNPDAAMDFFYPLFQTEDIVGHVILKGKQTFGDEWIHFNFDGFCPIHRVDHLGDYGNWRYTLRKGRYAGWKCWKDDSWRTTFIPTDLDKIPLI